MSYRAKFTESFIGQRLGTLEVIGWAKSKKYGRSTTLRLSVKCDCGFEFTTTGPQLANRKNLICKKCLYLCGAESAFNRLWTTYRGSAKAKGLEFSISQEYFRFLVQEKCHYCGCAPQSESIVTSGVFKYNGIDRIDSNLGYTITNTMPCCSICNYAKRKLSYSEFTSWIQKLSINQKRKDMIFDDYIKSMMCLLAWREERSNKVNGMLGVLFVLRNRVKAGWFGGDYLQNITKHQQFSSMSVSGDSQTIAYPQINDPEFTQILQLVDEVYDADNPRVDNITGGAKYYADLNNPTFTAGGWFQTHIINDPTNHPRSAQIGTTSYYK